MTDIIKWANGKGYTIQITEDDLVDLSDAIHEANKAGNISGQAEIGKFRIEIEKE